MIYCQLQGLKPMLFLTGPALIYYAYWQVHFLHIHAIQNLVMICLDIFVKFDINSFSTSSLQFSLWTLFIISIKLVLPLFLVTLVNSAILNSLHKSKDSKLSMDDLDNPSLMLFDLDHHKEWWVILQMVFLQWFRIFCLIFCISEKKFNRDRRHFIDNHKFYFGKLFSQDNALLITQWCKLPLWMDSGVINIYCSNACLCNQKILGLSRFSPWCIKSLFMLIWVVLSKWDFPSSAPPVTKYIKWV